MADPEKKVAKEMTTCDMHTGGEPLRIVTSGYPRPQGKTILEKRRFAERHLDRYRKFLMGEPRGHRDMYGAVLVEPEDPEAADFGVLFLHNRGYSTMCGHAVLALGRYAVDRKLVAPVSPETPLKIHCPCGVVRVFVRYENEKSGSVRFYGVPSFVYQSDVEISVNEELVKVDVVYGGAFYVVVPARAVKCNVEKSRYQDLVNAASSVTEAVKNRVTLQHPEDPDLSYLYGTILTGGTKDEKNFCVFADRQVDRSPTGSGVMARMALLHHRGSVSVDQTKVFSSFAGSVMTGRIVETVKYGPYPAAVVVEVSGNAYYTGSHRFFYEDDDPLKDGFFLDN
ncbi:trans-L-3-hydroxyproline dehydratase-like [Centruroides sculpturatus]|uniref:trans-L-3-hydroxyproline dehydratase-like n=1 Tax=Centruroides sculpturatus TaxID=218467 RepID=UPI000C6E4AC2|nr:trans-L-3-hydroxyproline dehydratase-like [Centruroides sculpturatus]